MSWHIFKKDCRLLWPLIAIVAIPQLLNAAVGLASNHAVLPPELRPMAPLISLIALLGVATAIVTALQQDAIPGTRQDWLVRPVRRRDLLLSKVLFVLVAVQGPLFVTDLIGAWAAGFSFAASFGAALTRGLQVLFVVSLPALVLAAITRNMTEAIAAALVLVAIGVGLVAMSTQFAQGLPMDLNVTPGLAWIIACAPVSIMALAALVILPLQYLRRWTLGARAVTVVSVAAAMLSLLLPWKTGFAIQQWFSSEPSLARSISLTFEPTPAAPGSSPERSAYGVRTDGETIRAIPFDKLTALPSDMPTAASRRVVAVSLPIRVTGLSDGVILVTDNLLAHFTAADGTSFDVRRDECVREATGLGRSCRINAGIEVRADQPNSDITHQEFRIPSEVYARVRGQQVRVEIHYSMTVLRGGGSSVIAAVGGDRQVPGFGSCSTKIDSDGDDVELSCFNTGRAPSCLTVVLEEASSGLRNPELYWCKPSYTPNVANLFPDGMNRSRLEMPFFDRTGLVRYPVDGPKIANSRFLLKSYQPRAHFMRTLVIPSVRLSDWVAERAMASGIAFGS